MMKRIWNFLTTRKPCFICERCGWREKKEQEVYCWKCNGNKKEPYAEMIYKRK